MLLVTVLVFVTTGGCKASYAFPCRLDALAAATSLVGIADADNMERDMPI
jgi:hypothetical protein